MTSGNETNGCGGDSFLFSPISFFFFFIGCWGVDDPMPAYSVVTVDFPFDGTFLLDDEDWDADGESVEEGLGDGDFGGVELGGAFDCEGEG